MLGKIVRWADTYASRGLEGLPENQQSKQYAFAVICLLGLLAALGYAIFYATYDLRGLWPAWSASIVFLVIAFVPILTRRNLFAGVLAGILMAIGVFTWLTWNLGTDAGLYLFLIVPIIAVLLVFGADHFPFVIALIVLLLGAMLANVIFFGEPSGLARVDPGLQLLLNTSTLIALTVMVAAAIRALAVRVAQAEAALAAEHARSEALLGNLLPQDIARRLKANTGEVIADGMPAVTLLFADLVGFTERAARSTPEHLVRFLNGIFTAFDRLTEARGLEKIKTIGDAYMVAAGLPAPRDDHAAVIADMALAMQAAVARLSRERGELIQLRIGIHSGPAIAGVIGSRKVFYDVWGDTVNTAARMESHGVPGRIQVTAATKALLEGRFDFTPRGIVEIKGIGPMETWWLETPSP